jgi:hypothetical protein
MPGDPAPQKGRPQREPTEEDLDAAAQFIARLMPSLERSTQEYRDKQRAVAELRAEGDGDTFDLRHGLLPPRNAWEQAEVDLYDGRITGKQFEEVFAKNPVDADLLTKFCDAYEQSLRAYSRMLQAMPSADDGEDQPDSRRDAELKVDQHVLAIEAKMPLWKEAMAAVFKFLVELRGQFGEPIQLGNFSGECAHMLAERVLEYAVKGWRSCKKIAERSQTDPRYLYAASAFQLFRDTVLPKLPKPNDLMTRMALERAAALKAIRDRDEATKSMVSKLPAASQTGDARPQPSEWQTIVEIDSQVKKLAPTDASILLLGETGTGKEFYANRVHQKSARKDKPFVAINCATLPKERIDAELFGYVKGAFTGAIENRAGRVREAEGGTVFLDEIGELPPDCWGNLLRFLQNKEIHPVGGKTITVDVRILVLKQAYAARRDGVEKAKRIGA